MEDTDIRAEAVHQEWVQEELEEKCKRLKEALRRIVAKGDKAWEQHEWADVGSFAYAHAKAVLRVE